MATHLSELKLSLTPLDRFQTIDITEHLPESAELLGAHPRTLLCSFHTTAGFLEQSLSVRLNNSNDLLSQFFRAFHSLFPEGADYRHDRMDLRSELNDQEKTVEPRNGDSHLTFIGSGMKNCVTYRTKPGTPVYFIDLDGKGNAGGRERKTMLLGFDRERVVDRMTFNVPMSKHPIDSINLADPRLGLLESVNERIRQSGIRHGRVDMFVGSTQRNAGLTVNEYETMLIQNDLVDVLRNPLRFARIKGQHMLEDPLTIPGKALSYAKYDAVILLNSLMEALRLDQSAFERLVAKVMSLPARRFLKPRRISFIVASDATHPGPQVLRGKYQSPILVQWQSAQGQTRHVDIEVTELS